MNRVRTNEYYMTAGSRNGETSPCLVKICLIDNTVGREAPVLGYVYREGQWFPESWKIDGKHRFDETLDLQELT